MRDKIEVSRVTAFFDHVLLSVFHVLQQAIRLIVSNRIYISLATGNAAVTLGFAGHSFPDFSGIYVRLPQGYVVVVVFLLLLF